MIKEFIPHEQALALKELGYNEGSFACVLGDGFNVFDIMVRYNTNPKFPEYYDVPLYQQAFRWLLKKHNLYAVIIPTVTMYWTFKTMTVVEGMIEVPPYNHVHATDYETREEAELECIKKLIEIIKEQK